MVVTPGGVLVVFNMTLNLVAVIFGLIASADHVFPHVMIASPKWDMACLVFSLTLF